MKSDEAHGRDPFTASFDIMEQIHWYVIDRLFEVFIFFVFYIDISIKMVQWNEVFCFATEIYPIPVGLFGVECQKSRFVLRYSEPTKLFKQ
jgi:hypothetical protein